MKSILIALLLLPAFSLAQSDPDSVMKNFCRYSEAMDFVNQFNLFYPDDAAKIANSFSSNMLCYPEYRKMLLGKNCTIEDVKKLSGAEIYKAFTEHIFKEFGSNTKFKFISKIVGSVRQDSITVQYVIKSGIIINDEEKSKTEIVEVQKYNNMYYVRFKNDQAEFFSHSVPKGSVYPFKDFNNKLIYVCSPDSQKKENILPKSDIIVFDPNSGQSAKLSADGYDYFNPVFGHEGARIYWSSNMMFGGGVRDYYLFYYDPSTGQIYSIKNDIPDFFREDDRISEGDWSVNSELAYCKAGYRSSADSLFLFNKTSKKNELLNVKGYYAFIRWSGNGDYLYFSKMNDKDTGFDGYIYNSGKTELIHDTTDRYIFVDWFPGQNKLLFRKYSDNDSCRLFSYEVGEKKFKPFKTISKFIGSFKCFGESDNYLFAVKEEDNGTQDIWSYNINQDSFKKITNDGNRKPYVSYSGKK